MVCEMSKSGTIESNGYGHIKEQELSLSPPPPPTTNGQQLAGNPAPDCPRCKGTGSCDSGGEMPWGAPIDVRCDCTYP